MINLTQHQSYFSLLHLIFFTDDSISPSLIRIISFILEVPNPLKFYASTISHPLFHIIYLLYLPPPSVLLYCTISPFTLHTVFPPFSSAHFRHPFLPYFHQTLYRLVDILLYHHFLHLIRILPKPLIRSLTPSYYKVLTENWIEILDNKLVYYQPTAIFSKHICKRLYLLLFVTTYSQFFMSLLPQFIWASIKIFIALIYDFSGYLGESMSALLYNVLVETVWVRTHVSCPLSSLFVILHVYDVSVNIQLQLE